MGRMNFFDIYVLLLKRIMCSAVSICVFMYVVYVLMNETERNGTSNAWRL